EKLGCSVEGLRRWVRQSERDNGQRPGLTTDDRQRVEAILCENSAHGLRGLAVVEEQHSTIPNRRESAFTTHSIHLLVRNSTSSGHRATLRSRSPSVDPTALI